MSENRKWLRYCYRFPQEYEDPETGQPTGDWIYHLCAIRSDGYVFVCYKTERERLSDEKLIAKVKQELWDKLETFIDDMPSNAIPYPNAETLNKGKIHQNGDKWIEVTDL